MSGGLFPSAANIGYSVIKAPQFKNKIQKGVSGRELRVAYQTVPTWLFTLTFEFLRDNNDQRQAILTPGWTSTYNELQTLMGFFLQQQGSLSTFLFDDPTDDNVVAQQIGVGDGTTTSFQLIRTMNGFNEPIVAPNTIGTVFFNGVPIPFGAFTVNYGTGVMTFVVPPPPGAVITASFNFFFVVRFADDTVSFENFLYQLWTVKELKLQSVLL